MFPAPPALCPEKPLVSCVRPGLWFQGMNQGNILSCFFIYLKYVCLYASVVTYVCLLACKCMLLSWIFSLYGDVFMF